MTPIEEVTEQAKEDEQNAFAAYTEDAERLKIQNGNRLFCNSKIGKICGKYAHGEDL